MSARLVQRFERNGNGRDFVVGDLHGCTAEFRELRRAVQFDASIDRVFSVGDLCDRGPDSIGALGLLYEPWFHAVRGNHEQMMVEALLGDADPGLWVYNGGGWAAGLSPEEDGVLRDLLPRVRDLPLVMVVGEGAHRFNVAHAQFVGTDGDIDGGVVNELLTLWGRDVVQGKVPTFTGEALSPTYCGHTILRDIARKSSHIFIDTGAFVAHGNYGTPMDARLTMVEPATGTVWQARKPGGDS